VIKRNAPDDAAPGFRRDHGVDFGTDVAGVTGLFEEKFQTAFGSFEFQDQPA